MPSTAANTARSHVAFRIAPLVVVAVALMCDSAAAHGAEPSGNDASAGVYAVLLMGLVVRVRSRRWRWLTSLVIAVAVPLLVGPHG